MKWFKHDVDAEEGKIVAHIVRKYGLEGEARYWRLVGILAKNFSSCKKGWFTLPLEAIQAKLRQRSVKDCTLFLDYLADYTPVFGQTKVNDFPFVVEYSGNNCRIKYDKIAKIKDNHTTNLQATSKRLASNLSLDKNKIKNKKKSKDSGDFSSPSPSKKSIPEIVAEVTALVRTFRSGTELQEHLKNASDEARRVFAGNSMVSIGNSDSFELTAIVKNALRGVA